MREGELGASRKYRTWPANESYFMLVRGKRRICRTAIFVKGLLDVDQKRPTRVESHKNNKRWERERLTVRHPPGKPLVVSRCRAERERMRGVTLASTVEPRCCFPSRTRSHFVYLRNKKLEHRPLVYVYTHTSGNRYYLVIIVVTSNLFDIKYLPTHMLISISTIDRIIFMVNN